MSQNSPALSDEGVLALVTDTTNVERPGFVPSERIVGQTFERIIREAEGRVIIASFASQIHRMQMAVDSSLKLGRKVAAMGRSMANNMDMAAKLGYLSVPEGVRVAAKILASISPARSPFDHGFARGAACGLIAHGVR